MSLYLDYRPANLRQVRGNEDIVKTLDKMLSTPETCPHVFLLHGPTGCGKTTIARIIADRLGCKGSDFQEVDSGQFRGIDTVRDMRKNSQYMPIEGSCRVWLLDEAHKLTSDAMNALLKILEDTPAHVYFILCTTDPQKLIAAVKGRCQQFQVKPLTNDDMQALLEKIAKREGETIEQEVIDQILQDSQGLPRNAIQILEQVLAAEPEERLKIAKQTAERESQSIELCRALLKPAKWKEIADILKGLKEQNDAEGVRRVVLGYCQSILLNGAVNGQAGLILEEFTHSFYDSGFPQLTLACFTVICGNKE